MRKERECRGNMIKDDKKSRRNEKRSAGGVMEQLGSSFTLHCGPAPPMTLSSVSIYVCVCVCVSVCVHSCFRQVSNIESCYLTQSSARATTNSTLPNTHTHTHTCTHTCTHAHTDNVFRPEMVLSCGELDEKRLCLLGMREHLTESSLFNRVVLLECVGGI